MTWERQHCSTGDCPDGVSLEKQLVGDILKVQTITPPPSLASMGVLCMALFIKRKGAPIGK